MPTKTKDTKTKRIKKMGSDCKFCFLDEGVYNMIYFCKNKELAKDTTRILCLDGFTGICEYFKKTKA